MAVRQDLLALTPAAIASLANMGLYKRAQKELDEGKAPALETADDGTVKATFADGAEAKLVPGKGLKDCPCTCGATAVCRHRVAAILAYQKTAATTAAPDGPIAAPGKPWSPADVTDEALEKLLGRAALERARTLRKRGVLVEVTRGDFQGDALPRAQLATSTVRFLVHGDVGYARCDCRLRTSCEHVAVAVWAFREAQQKDPAAATVTVEVADAAASGEKREAGLSAAREIAALVLLEGASRLPAAAAARFALARAGLERARHAWPLMALEELEELLGAYARRSARYSPERLAATVAELFARERAGHGGGELPPAAVLGSDEAPEAALDQVRLAALGARVHADGDDRVVEILLADPSSQSVMVLRRVVSPQEGGRPEDGPALARRSALSGTPLGMVASCQLVSNAAVRRPNRLIHFQTGPLKKTSVLGGGATIDTLPQDLVVRDTAAFCKSLAARSPRALRPRLLAENVRAFALSRVEELGYDVGEQAVRASCLDESGHELLLTLRHRSVAPAALEALALHLGRSTVRAVVGDGRRVSGVLVVEPIALMTEKLVVLDLEPPSPEGEKALAALPHARSGLARSALSQAVDEARGVLDEAAHQGLRAPPPGWVERLREARLRLSELGLAHAADDLEVLEHAGAAARSTGAEVDEAGAVEAWATASLRLELLSDRL